MSIYMKNGEEIKFYGRKLPARRGRIDKEEANSAFKKYKKEILDVFFAENGFYKHKTTAYVRLSEVGVLQNVNLQKSQFDGGLFYVNYEVVPLYRPVKGRGFMTGLDSRLDKYDQDWRYDDYEIAQITFEDLREALQTCMLPWFDEFCDEENYREMLLKDQGKNWCRGWLEALERSEEERKATMLENIEKFKLPKKLAQSILS